jgi:hypothetical protein
MNTKIDCLNFSGNEYPKIKKGMFVELWNGNKGHIEVTDGYYSFFNYDNNNAFHIMDIKYIECNLKDLAL